MASRTNKRHPGSNPIGRPRLYDPKYCAMVIALGEEGKSQMQISAEIDVNRTTMLMWCDQHPEFLTALTRAKELEQAWWERRAQGALENKDFNANLWAKSVAARFRKDYGDHVVQEHVGKDGEPLILWGGKK